MKLRLLIGIVVSAGVIAGSARTVPSRESARVGVHAMSKEMKVQFFAADKELVVVGVVTEMSRGRWLHFPENQRPGRTIVRDVVLDVEEYVKGDGPPRLPFIVLGGMADDMLMTSHPPRFRRDLGDTLLMFLRVDTLWCRDRAFLWGAGHWQVVGHESPAQRSRMGVIGRDELGPLRQFVRSRTSEGLLSAADTVVVGVIEAVTEVEREGEFWNCEVTSFNRVSLNVVRVPGDGAVGSTLSFLSPVIVRGSGGGCQVDLPSFAVGDTALVYLSEGSNGYEAIGGRDGYLIVRGGSVWRMEIGNLGHPVARGQEVSLLLDMWTQGRR